MKKTEAIKKFLEMRTHPFLAALYNHDMEVQVNVAQGVGVPVDGEYKGKRWVGFTDSVNTWKPFRIPYNANTEPTYEDSNITYDISVHADGVGMTGWDWKSRVSKWVAFDFDALLGHSAQHQKKLSVEELNEIKQTVAQVPWVTLLKSTSGRGLHLYVHLQPFVQTANHNEHAALARAILSMLSGLTGYDFASKVDVCGGNMWVWHKKMEGTDGLTMLKQGTVLENPPANWKEHLKIVTRKAKRIRPSGVTESNKEVDFDDLIDKRTYTTLDEDHKRLLKYLEEHGARWWWDSDNHMLVTHTHHLKQAHATLQMAGPFETVSTGADAGNDHNCFAFPLRNGCWVIRRYGQRTAEAATWYTDSKGWTKCYYNRVPDLATVCRLFNAIETDKEGYQFANVQDVQKALKLLGLEMPVPLEVLSRKCNLVEMPKKDRLVVSFAKQENDEALTPKMPGFFEKGKLWKRVFPYYAHAQIYENFETENYDERIRHLVTTNNTDAGWTLKVGDSWREENLTHIRLVLSSAELDQKDISPILGECVENGWRLVNKPFQPEYPGNREWNRNTARLRCVPSVDLDQLNYPTWSLVLSHCGASLNEAILADPWCKKNCVLNGEQYLTLWWASLLQHPSKPLPYLFFYGEQNSGKSVLHEAVTKYLIIDAHMRANAALTSQANFNAELESKLLCIVEEVDLRKHNSEAYNKIKDWVTSPELLIHVKGATPYLGPNYTHWIQVANDPSYCPIFAGDTRIVVCRVDLPQKIIPKDTLLKSLEKEAPDFLAHLLNIEIPDAEDRLGLPVITTDAKREAMENNMSPIEHFIHKNKLFKRGHAVSASDFATAFRETIDEVEHTNWSKNKIGREISKLSKHPKGIIGQVMHYANLSLDPNAQDLDFTLVNRDGMLIKQALPKPATPQEVEAAA
jgi:hypothetical protein